MRLPSNNRLNGAAAVPTTSGRDFANRTEHVA